MDKDTVTIQVKDYQNNNQKKTVTLKAVEFIRRFLMHILPKGLVKIRHYGLLANRNKKTKLKLCRKLTNSPTYIPKFQGLSTIEIVSLIMGKDVCNSNCSLLDLNISVQLTVTYPTLLTLLIKVFFLIDKIDAKLKSSLRMPNLA